MQILAFYITQLGLFTVYGQNSVQYRVRKVYSIHLGLYTVYILRCTVQGQDGLQYTHGVVYCTHSEVYSTGSGWFTVYTWGCVLYTF
jgi:hypothetical protein